MAEKTVLEIRNVSNVADDLDGLRDYFRILEEMLIEQLCSYTVKDEESMGRSLERIHFLVNSMPQKITFIESLGNELYAMRKTQKQGVIAT